MFIARKIKEDNIYIPNYINHRQNVHRTLYYTGVYPVIYITVRPLGAALDIYEGGKYI